MFSLFYWTTMTFRTRFIEVLKHLKARQSFNVQKLLRSHKSFMNKTPTQIITRLRVDHKTTWKITADISAAAAFPDATMTGTEQLSGDTDDMKRGSCSIIKDVLLNKKKMVTVWVIDGLLRRGVCECEMPKGFPQIHKAAHQNTVYMDFFCERAFTIHALELITFVWKSNTHTFFKRRQFWD